jgi:aspartyl-tRNA(Asn)/glutamyl-tRNA(Gln) amidotransferase subunit C
VSELLSRERVAHIADLTRLSLDDEEVKAMAHHLNKMAEFCAIIDEVNTDGVDPLHHVFDARNVFREDKLESASWSSEVGLRLAPERAGDFFKVPPIKPKEE